MSRLSPLESVFRYQGAPSAPRTRGARVAGENGVQFTEQGTAYTHLSMLLME
ncbi:hypothetical protein TNCT1_36260 [Streptomyces sp. 1-11]|nr:hypothetical protein TNCT1_36260 [Streptomyces sp. 1-11]